MSLRKKYPILQFFLIGAGIFLLQKMAFEKSKEQENHILVSSSMIQELKIRFPSPDIFKEEFLLKIDREILIKEALELNLHHNDLVIRDRLLKNMNFLETKEKSNKSILEKSQKIGMLQSDPVIRKRLIHKMESVLGNTEGQGFIREKEFESSLDEGRDFSPKLYSFKHLYFKKKPTGGVGKGEGDNFHLGHELSYSQSESCKNLGRDFCNLENLVLKKWVGPYQSIFGHHFIYLIKIIPSQVKSEKLIFPLILLRIQEKRKRLALNEQMNRLRRKYNIKIDHKLFELSELIQSNLNQSI